MNTVFGWVLIVIAVMFFVITLRGVNNLIIIKHTRDYRSSHHQKALAILAQVRLTRNNVIEREESRTWYMIAKGILYTLLALLLAHACFTRIPIK